MNWLESRCSFPHCVAMDYSSQLIVIGHRFSIWVCSSNQRHLWTDYVFNRNQQVALINGDVMVAECVNVLHFCLVFQHGSLIASHFEMKLRLSAICSAAIAASCSLQLREWPLDGAASAWWRSTQHLKFPSTAMQLLWERYSIIIKWYNYKGNILIFTNAKVKWLVHLIELDRNVQKHLNVQYIYLPLDGTGELTVSSLHIREMHLMLILYACR